MIDTDLKQPTDLAQPIPLSVAARETPNRNGGRGVNVATTWRWALHGVRGVRLESWMIGGTRMTSRAALQRFHDDVTAASTVAPVPVHQRTPHQRERAVTAAKARLAADGI